MVLASGKYRYSFTWEKYSPTSDTTYGQGKPSYAQQSGVLWGSLETLSAAKQEYYDAQQATVQATIRLRQFPAVSALDRLVDRRWGEVWVIDGVRRSDLPDNETIISAHKWDNQGGTL